MDLRRHGDNNEDSIYADSSTILTWSGEWYWVSCTDAVAGATIVFYKNRGTFNFRFRFDVNH